jgi:hypothetical protein
MKLDEKETPEDSPMNEASRWRFALAERVGREYAANPKARVVMVAGSTGRGTADRYSDIEIDIYWSEPPTNDERRAAVERSGGTLLGKLLPAEDDEWSEEISLGGFYMHTSTFLVETMERYLREALEEFSTALNPQMRLSSLMNARTLVGEDLVARWRERARAYPTGLAEAVVREHLAFGRLSYNGPMLAARNDLLPLYESICETEREILWVLMGLNRLYVPAPSLKQSDELIAQMTIVPRDIARRLKGVFRLPPSDAADALFVICEDVFELVEAHLPGVDTREGRRWLRHHRGVWDEPPEL